MAKKSLFITRNDFPPSLHELLEENFKVVCWSESTKIPKDKLLENVKGKFGIITSPSIPIDKEVIEAAGDTLKVVSTWSVGFNHLDIDELRSRKIRIGHTPGISAFAVAEYAIALLLATSRHVVKGHNAIVKGDWRFDKWTINTLVGPGLYKSNAAVVGCGRIGLSILKNLTPFNPENLWYYSRSRKPEADELGADLRQLDFIMKESDFIIVALDQNAQTIGIIDKNRINSMKSTSILINIGRGGLLDEDALIEALQNKKIAGAGLDVFSQEPLPINSPLIKLDNVVLSPHLAYRSYGCLASRDELTALNVLAVLNGTEMPAEVL